MPTPTPTLSLDLFWSFRSPYSYLVTPDLLRLREDYDVDIALRIVLPIAVREPEAFKALVEQAQSALAEAPQG